MLTAQMVHGDRRNGARFPQPNYTADIREGVAVEYVSCEPTEGWKELFPEVYGEEYEVPEDEKTEQG